MRLGMSPEQFADMLGWSEKSAVKSVSNLEGGREDPSIKVLRQILRKLGTGIDECLNFPDNRLREDSTLDLAQQILHRGDGHARELEMFVLGMSKGIGIRARVAPPDHHKQHHVPANVPSSAHRKHKKAV